MGISAAGRLMVLAAARPAGGARPGLRARFANGLAVLRWSVNRDDIVHRYYQRKGHNEMCGIAGKVTSIQTTRSSTRPPDDRRDRAPGPRRHRP